MIKLGSRTELVLPAEEGLEFRVRLGDNVIAGTTVQESYAAGKTWSGLAGRRSFYSKQQPEA